MKLLVFFPKLLMYPREHQRDYDDHPQPQAQAGDHEERQSHDQLRGRSTC